jgi:hypothetical protein
MLPRKTRSLCDIYNIDTTHSFLVFVLFSQIDDPLTFEEAFKYDVWAQAMDEEIKCIENNQTWKLVDVPEDKDVISVKWIYKTKQDANGNVQKHKERLVARGFNSNMKLNSMKHLRQLCAWIQLELCCPLLRRTNGLFIKWM